MSETSQCPDLIWQITSGNLPLKSNLDYVHRFTWRLNFGRREMKGIPYTTAVDVYAYAMLLYELVVFAKPWAEIRGHEDRQAVFELRSYLNAGSRPTIPNWVPPAYSALITSCWAQNPDERPSFRSIVEQIQGEVLAFPATDSEEYEMYQREMLAELGDPPPGSRR